MTTIAISKLNRKQNHQKLYLLQVFRGIAALLVVMAHGELIFYENLNKEFLFNLFAFGGSGVDFFFVLSGFIITYIHAQDIGRAAQLKSFILKRFIRIYPIYWLILTSKLIASIIFGYSNTNERSFLEIIQAFLLFPQDRVILSESFLGVSWTLSYELFFYLGFCFLIASKPKLYTPIISLWLLGVFLNFTHLLQLPVDNVLLQFLFSELHFEFILGCLAAYIVRNYQIKKLENLIYIGLVFYTLAAINTNYGFLPISDVIAYGISTTILVIGAFNLEKNHNLIIPPLLLLLGDASYSIYLIHGFVMSNITKITIKLNLLEIVTANEIRLSLFAIFNAVVAVAVGCIIYRLIEKSMLSSLRILLIKL
jgi:peptidoglycan/LPS O-acetylase OafA/YrhL